MNVFNGPNEWLPVLGGWVSLLMLAPVNLPQCRAEVRGSLIQYTELNVEEHRLYANSDCVTPDDTLQSVHRSRHFSNLQRSA